MSEVQRLAHADDDWATAPVPVAGPRATGKPGDPARAVNALARVNAEIDRLERYTAGAVAVLLDGLDAPTAVGLVAAIQDVRRRLADIEAYAARQIGRDEFALADGILPDGRTYAVLKGKDRRAWDHDGWKRDARRQVLSGVSPDLVDPSTGETVAVEPLLEAIQGIGSSAPPKVTALKALGLDPDEYAETVPGPWGVKISPRSE